MMREMLNTKRRRVQSNKVTRLILLQPDSIDPLLHLAKQIAHSVTNPICLQPARLTARPIHPCTSWPAQGQTHTPQVHVQRRRT
jgi:hypothetical protein